MKGWEDLKRRVGPDRRLFGFFYHKMPNEPLAFVQVALTKELTGTVQDILNEPTPATITSTSGDIKCAIFYSVTSQQGLSGIELGSSLIRRAVHELQLEFPSIETFSTLSPIPGFRRWLEEILDKEGESVFENGEGDSLRQLFKDIGVRQNLDSNAANMKAIIRTSRWITHTQSVQALKPILMRLCARYVLIEKKGKYALDPVANFHIRNGACVHRLNWLSDVSVKGMNESLGIMANYNYLLECIEQNNLHYLRDGAIVLSSDDPYLVAMAQKCKDVLRLSDEGGEKVEKVMAS